MEARTGRRSRWLGAGILLVAGVLIAKATLTGSNAVGGSSGSRGLCLLACGSRGLADAIANVILFLPFGVGLWMLSGRVGRATAIGMLASMAIELAQLSLIQGRDANPSDVISNTAGAALGALLARWWISSVPRTPRPGRYSLVTAAAALIAVLAATGLLFLPSLPAGPYRVEWQNGSERYGAYQGDISRAALGNRAVPIHGGILTDRPGDRLDGGEPLVVTVRKAAGYAGLEHLLSLEQGEKDVLFLGIDGGDVVLRYETWATRLRLDTPSVRLEDGLANVDVGDTVSLVVRRSGSGYCVEAMQRRACPRNTLASGWRLIHNIEYISRWVVVRMNSVWLFLLALPLGLCARRDTFSLLVVGGTGAGVVVLTALLAAAPLSGLEWIFAILGLAFGWLLGAWRRLPLTGAT